MEDLSPWFKTLHILFAIVAVGLNISYGIWQARAASSPEHMGFALRGIKFLDDRANHEPREVVRPNRCERAAVSPDRGANRLDDPCLADGSTGITSHRRRWYAVPFPRRPAS